MYVPFRLVTSSLTGSKFLALSLALRYGYCVHGAIQLSTDVTLDLVVSYCQENCLTQHPWQLQRIVQLRSPHLDLRTICV